ncbi:inhibitor of apoptosis-promoting Bax1-domain-containing protein [Obelidium mucronatum]|nr:inhibitor of apoptosis-promoting Bax1-domain-containing protein [Obelidium mucronatum]
MQHPPQYSETDALLEQSLPPSYKSLADCNLDERVAFIRKVYTVLAAQFGLTTVISALFMYNDSIRHVVQSNGWAVMLSSWGGLFILLALMWFRKQEPINKYLLVAFTMAESYTIGVVCTFYQSETVLQAVILTFSVFIALTIFTLQSKISFEGLGPFLFTSLSVLVVASFIEIFFPFSRAMDLVIAIVTAIVFCGYILYDTWQLFERLDQDEWVVGAVELYLDVVNLFLAFLRILSSNDD